MTDKLFAARYENDLTEPAMLEFVNEPAEVGIRWSLPGGLQRLELTVRAKSREDAYDRYRNHMGHRWAILDTLLDRPVCDGWVYEIVPDGRHVHYIVGGPWKRHNDDPYLVTDFPGTGNTDAIIKDMLTNRVPVASSDQSNIASTGTAIGGWSPPETVGIAVQQAINELCLLSDSTTNIYDYWLRSAKLGDALTLQLPIPYLVARSSTAESDWIVQRQDLARGGASFSRHAWELKRSIKVAYARLNGTHTGGNNSASLITAGSFITQGVNIGDTVINVTDGCSGRVATVAATTLTFTALTGGTDNDFDTNDRYVIKLQKPLLTGAVTSLETDLWTTSLIVSRPEMDSAGALLFRNRLLAEYEKVVQQQAFTITSPRLQWREGGRFPLWRLIKSGGGYIRGHGLHQWAGLFDVSLDRLQAFRITAMDYDYTRNQLRIVPDTIDSRLDIILKQAGLSSGEIISRAIPTRKEYA